MIGNAAFVITRKFAMEQKDHKKYYIDYLLNDNQNLKTLGPFNFKDGTFFFINNLSKHVKTKTTGDFFISSSFYLKENNTKHILISKENIKVKNESKS